MDGTEVPWISSDCRSPNSACIGASCTANDVDLAIVEVLTNGTTQTCEEGSLVVKSLKFKLICGATNRYDIGIFCEFFNTLLASTA